MGKERSKLYENLRKYTLYALFLGVIGNLAIQAKLGKAKVALIVLFITLLLMIVIYEYLKYFFDKAVNAINVECDPAKGKEYFDTLIKRDIFKFYRKNRFAFDIIYNLSINNPKECLNIIRKEHQYFNSTINNNLIQISTMMMSYMLLDNKSQVIKLYGNLLRIKNDSRSFKRASSNFNWKEFEGLFELASDNYKKASNIYSNVDISKMNNREYTQHLYFYSIALVNSKQYYLAKEILSKCIEVGNKTAFSKLSRNLLNTIK